jgi:cytoskeleton protein RodZ
LSKDALEPRPLSQPVSSTPPIGMNENIGQQLRQERESQKISLEQVSSATHIRLHYLQALESGEFDALPSMVQAKGFTRAYAAYLGMNIDPLLSGVDQQEFVADIPPAVQLEPGKEGQSSQEESIEAIFVDIGQRLQHQRELLGLSLEDVERHTHLRQRYLIALEAGDLSGLPSPVQGRGMLNNYASFLGLDAEPLLLRFAQGLQAQLAARQATRPSPSRPVHSSPRPPGLLRRVFTAQSLLAAIITQFLGGFVVWAAVRIFAIRADSIPSPTAPSIAEVLLSAPRATATPTSLPPTQTPPPPRPAASDQAESTQVFAVLPGVQAGVQVYTTVRQRAWMRVIVDGEVVFEGRVLPGSAYQYEGEETVELLTSNGAALQIFFNQQDLGPMGLYGQVVQRIFTLEGVQTPTPTVTFTPTVTPRITPTPPATAASP